LSLHSVIGFDLGTHPAAVVAAGTDECPVLLGSAVWDVWDSDVIVAQIEQWVERYEGARLWCEETFSHGTKRKGWLRDVGRVQEGQAGYLEGALAGTCEVLRVPPVDGNDAQVAWIQFGRPAIGKGQKGEHVRDALGVALKGLIRQRTPAAHLPEEVKVKRYLEGAR